MAKRTTRWSPDTCGCVLEYEWDDSEDENTRTHSFKRIIKACPEHTALAGKSHYDQVLSENTRKNITFGEIRKALPKEEITPDNYLWFFDKDRVLQVSLVGVDLPEAAKRGLQTALDARFGAGKAKVL